MRFLPAAALSEWILVCAAAPLLLFFSGIGSGVGAAVGLALITPSWALRRLVTGQWTVSSPANAPCLLLLGTLFLSLVPSVRLDYSGPKFWGMILGLAVFSLCLNTCRAPAVRRLAAGVFLLAGATTAVAGVLYMGRPEAKLLPGSFLGALLSELPGGPSPVQSSTTVVAGINPNEVGGMLTLLLPLAVVLSIGGGRLRLAALPIAFVLLSALILTESRAAVAGVVVSLAFGALWAIGRRSRLMGLVGLTITLTGTTALAALQPQLFTLSYREVPWQAGLLMLLDMPLTGIGLNTFTVILPRFYPAAHEDGATYAHAHNLFLQTWLDLGFLGLVAFLAIVALAVRAGLRPTDRDAQAAVSQPGDWPRTVDHWITIGLLLSLLAHGIYSLADAVTLGAKPSVALWAVLGLLVAGSSAGAPVSVGAAVGSQPAPGALMKAKKVILGWPVGVRASTLMVLLALVISPLSVNAARLVLHHVDARAAPAEPVVASLLDADLEIGGRLAWGPYEARVQAARGLLAEVRERPVAVAVRLGG